MSIRIDADGNVGIDTSDTYFKSDYGVSIIMDRFDFEQQIMTCWNVVEDVKTIGSAIDSGKLSNDTLHNALIGIETLYQMKFEKLFEMFEVLVRRGDFK